MHYGLRATLVGLSLTANSKASLALSSGYMASSLGLTIPFVRSLMASSNSLNVPHLVPTILASLTTANVALKVDDEPGVDFK